MLIHFYLFSSIFVYFGRFLSICNRFHPFPPHYRFLHDQVWRNGLPTLLKSLIRTVWAYSESQTAQILDWGYLRKNSFFAQNGRKTIFEWPKVVSEVILGGSLYWKVFSEFRNCDRKCRFWDIAICAILRAKTFQHHHHHHCNSFLNVFAIISVFVIVFLLVRSQRLLVH